MKRQRIEGDFTMDLGGNPFVFRGKTIFRSKTVTKNDGVIYSLHLGPIVIGWAWRRRK